MYYKILVSVLKYMRERKKNSPRAQTTPYASFEPILVVATLHYSSVCILELIYAIKFLLVAKNMKKKKYEEKKILTKCPNDTPHIIWARFGHCHPPSLSLSLSCIL